jgi:HemY protein
MRIFSLFLIFLISVCLGLLLSHNPGYILIVVHHWSIQTSLIVGIAILVLIFLLLHLLLIGLHKINTIPESLDQWRAKRRIHYSQKFTNQGLIEFCQGYWSSAKKHLINGLPYSETPLVNYLTAASASQELGDTKLRDEYLQRAEQSVPEAKIAVQISQAKLQMEQQQWEQALSTLKDLQTVIPKNPYVLTLLMQLYQQIKAWPKVISLLPILKKQHIISVDDYEKAMRQAYLQSLLESNRFTLEEQDILINNLPKNLKDDPEIMNLYCQILIQKGEKEEAESLLRLCLKRQFSDLLIKRYGTLSVNQNQLHFAESLLKKYPDSPELLLCLGKLSRHFQLWGKAIAYLEKSIALKPSPDAYLQLGDLYTQLDKQIDAGNAYKKGLKQIVI